MLLVIASRYDRLAPALVERWQQLDARLVTCRDLSAAGWRYYPGDARNSRAVIAGEIVPFEWIRGALICMPAVNENELVHIEHVDRAYVAAEMNAFLMAWLSEAMFPVVNRPSPPSLMGPSWSHSRWIHEAARAGLRHAGATQALARPDNSAELARAKVAVVGDRCFGNVARLLTLQAKRLGAAAQVQALTVVFNGPDSDSEFVEAYPAVDLEQTEIADSLLDCLSVSAAVSAGVRKATGTCR